ncbi:hypothetical protein CEXT_412231 [Caerostris extrusa]|uniref:Uncharacterized protein n=1 Tax=Caerostris extrusa TaxID=172846 RepID=A0AAV4R340_CAEEX|nr:hypothetical protein CEXT_412231 [Caerostris extrusa]
MADAFLSVPFQITVPRVEWRSITRNSCDSYHRMHQKWEALLQLFHIASYLGQYFPPMTRMTGMQQDFDERAASGEGGRKPISLMESFWRRERTSRYFKHNRWMPLQFATYQQSICC